MADTKKKEDLSESNFGHTEDEWGTKKKYSECNTCENTKEKRKKNSESKNYRIQIK